jgi:ADP-heptose:LPS heptosyltransferase
VISKIDTKVKIAVIRLGAMGDVLMTTPIIRKLYLDRKGQCEIHFFTSGILVSPLVNSPYIHKLHEGKINESHLNTFDLVIDLDSGYEYNSSMHVVDAYGLRAFGHISFDKSLDLFTTIQDQQSAKEFADSIGNKFAIFHVRNIPGPRSISKDIWKSIIEHVLTNSNISIVFIGTENDFDYIGNDRLIDARTKFSIPVLKEIIELSTTFVGSDSGPANIAATTKSNMIVCYTDVRAEYRNPYRIHGRFIPFNTNIECYGCRATRPVPVHYDACARGDNECVNRFDPIAIANAILELSI